MADENSVILKVRNLSIGIKGETDLITNDISFDINRGEITALVGESGSGKSLSALSIVGLLADSLTVKKGECLYNNQDLYNISSEALRSLRGHKISVVFQEPMTALNPLHKIGQQIEEVLLLHTNMDKNQRQKKILSLLDDVHIKDTEQKIKAYPHELSGGQRQRVMIAMALANNPDILILDEPTTALDVTVQARILSLLKDIQKKHGTSMLLISHDLPMISKMADHVYVMKKGQIIEQGKTGFIMKTPKQDYTKSLINALPVRDLIAVDKDAPTYIKAKDIHVKYPIKSPFLRITMGHHHAVNNINFSLKQGETLGIVGESGSGKSSLAAAILQINNYQGDIFIEDILLKNLSIKALRAKRSVFQPVFQDPYAALSPRMNIEQILMEGMNIHFKPLSKQEKQKRICDTLEDISMDPKDVLRRYPHEFSGGQRQRIAIARAIILRPKILILDEPTSALDLTVQKQVLSLLGCFQRKYNMSYIFISHDLGVVRAISHRVIVLKNGNIVEQGETENIFMHPKQPYTKNLIASIDYI